MQLLKKIWQDWQWAIALVALLYGIFLFYYKTNCVTTIIITPKINPIKIYLFEYFLASSNISLILIEIMIPATNNNIILIKKLDIYLYKNK